MKKLRLLILFTIALICSKYTVGQWVKIADLPNNHFSSIQFIDDTIGFTIGDQFVYKTVDGGYNWDSTSLGGSLDILYEMEFIHKDTGFIVGDVSGYQGFYTFDQGENWATVAPYQLNTDLAIINGHEIFRSANLEFGLYKLNINEWTVIEHFTGEAVFDIKVISEDTIYVGGGSLAKSYDGGENWTLFEMPGAIIWMDFPSSKVGYASDGNTYKTSDSGESWTELEIPYFFDQCTSPKFINDSIGYWACGKYGGFEYYGIMKTYDGGISWKYNESIPPLFDDDLITTIFCMNSDTCWCVTDDGQVYITENGGGETQPPVSILENSEINISIFPNPTDGILNIEFAKSFIPQTIVITDISGAILINEEISETSGILFNFDISNLRPGIYLISVSNERGHTQYDKVIKL